MSDIGFQGYAPGAIRNRAALLDYIIEARKERKAVRLFAVVQSGHLSEMFLTSKSAISEQDSSGIESFTCWQRATWTGRKYYRSHHCLGDLNVAGKQRRGGHNRHQLFANRRLAQEYSEILKADRAYLAAVAEHHRHCAKLFSDLWR